MNSGFPLFDIILLALVAAFLAYRLRSVLGKRTGHEKQQPNPFQQGPTAENGDQASDNVVRMPERRSQEDAPDGQDETLASDDDKAPETPSSPLAGGLTQIKIADPSFRERDFLEGAQAAFGMILEAFASGDRQTLKNLQAPDVYAVFDQALGDRESRGESLESRLLEIKTADLTSAWMDGSEAVLEVRFVSDQVHITRDSDGQIIDGTEDDVESITDLWTFRRDTSSRDPNWLLTETATD